MHILMIELMFIMPRPWLDSRALKSEVTPAPPSGCKTIHVWMLGDQRQHNFDCTLGRMSRICNMPVHLAKAVPWFSSAKSCFKFDFDKKGAKTGDFDDMYSALMRHSLVAHPPGPKVYAHNINKVPDNKVVGGFKYVPHKNSQGNLIYEIKPSECHEFLQPSDFVDVDGIMAPQWKVYYDNEEGKCMPDDNTLAFVSQGKIVMEPNECVLVKINIQ
jgi:hypothetical protein